MKPLPDKHRETLLQRFAAEGPGNPPSAGARHGSFTAPPESRALLQHLGIDASLGYWPVTVCALADHILALQVRIEALERSARGD